MKKNVRKSDKKWVSHICDTGLIWVKNIELLSEELNVIKIDDAFKEYAMSYKVELVKKKDPLTQLEASNSSIKDFCNDLLDETNGFKYQITLKVEI